MNLRMRRADDDFVTMMRESVAFGLRERLRHAWWETLSPHAMAAMCSAYTAAPFGLFDHHIDHC